MIGLHHLNHAWFDNPYATNYLFVFTIVILCLFEMSTKSTKPFENIAFSTFSIGYYSFFLSSIYHVSFQGGAYSNIIVFALIALTWTNDTMAYMVGSRVGKTKMFERMSPKKTWEGTIGGILFTVLVAFIIYHFSGLFTPATWLGLAIIIGIFGTLGDLVESMLKRSYTMKDTGSLLPGHGGLLDRFDSLTFHLPLSVYFIQITSSF
jgi:phosphatidate cytidylyltransferase